MYITFLKLFLTLQVYIRILFFAHLQIYEMNLYLMKYEEFIYSKTCTYIIMFCDVILRNCTRTYVKTNTGINIRDFSF